jgi:acetyl-CoA carboxylase carboxyltransferase component
VVVANDANRQSRCLVSYTAKKNLRAQEIAMENRLPIIYLVDSAGVYCLCKMKFSIKALWAYL